MKYSLNEAINIQWYVEKMSAGVMTLEKVMKCGSATAVKCRILKLLSSVSQCVNEMAWKLAWNINAMK